MSSEVQVDKDGIMWKFIPIEIYSQYKISEYGVVKNTANKNRIMKLTLHAKSEYFRVALSHNSKQVKFAVHRLVALTFLEPIPGKDYVNHIDGNKENNHYTNLEWVSPSENNLHAFRTGLNKPSGTVRVGLVNNNGKVIKEYNTLKEAAKDNGTSEANIRRCYKGLQKTAKGKKFIRLDGDPEIEPEPEDGVIWDEYPDYLWTEYGRCYSKNRKRYLPGYEAKAGMTVLLYRNNESRQVYVRRIIGMLFRDAPLEDTTLRFFYKDGNMYNDDADNLMWKTRTAQSDNYEEI